MKYQTLPTEIESFVINPNQSSEWACEGSVARECPCTFLGQKMPGREYRARKLLAMVKNFFC
jgi:hypothetical protein